MVGGTSQRRPRVIFFFGIIVTGLIWVGPVPLFATALNKRIQVVVHVGKLAVSRARQPDGEIGPAPADHGCNRITYCVVPLTGDLAGLKQRYYFVIGSRTIPAMISTVRRFA